MPFGRSIMGMITKEVELSARLVRCATRYGSFDLFPVRLMYLFDVKRNEVLFY